MQTHTPAMDMTLDMIGNSQNQENPRCTTNLGYIFVYNKLEENTHYWNFEYEALIKSAFFFLVQAIGEGGLHKYLSGNWDF